MRKYRRNLWIIYSFGISSWEWNNMLKKVQKAENWLREKSGIRPEILLMTGTGLGGSTGGIKVSDRIPYESIPGFPVSTVEGHAGELVLGTLGGKNVAAMRGRFHLYEGYSPLEIALPVRVLHGLGARVLVLTNAAGGLGTVFRVGDLMLIRDHINFTGENPLVGPNEEFWGPRFPDMSKTYDPDLRVLAKAIAKKLGIPLQEGVYLGLKGPSFETPAEVRFFSMIGGQAVGMSTIMEVIAAKHLGMKIIGISSITNVNDPDHPEEADIESVVEEAEKAGVRLEQLITALVEAL